MTAIAFALTALEDGRRLGFGLVCAEARFATLRWQGRDRLDRLFLPPQMWLAVERSIRDRLEPGPLPTDHPIVVALLPSHQRSGFVIQYLYAVPVNDGPTAAEDLDAILRSLIVPSLRQIQE